MSVEKTSPKKKNEKEKDEQLESHGFYEVTPINMSNKYDKDAALRELALLQSNAIVDYKTWAKERVKYTELSSEKSKQALKECNDAYTISILSNCIAPFSQGVTLGSVMSSWFTYKSAQMLNPQFNQDVSRMMLNMRDSMVPLLAQNAKQTANPVAKMFYNGLLEELDTNVVESSTHLLHNDVVRNLENNTLDDMVMTPRQVAAIKLNFMEQFYVDARQYNIETKDGKDKLVKLQKDYDTALQHLNIIANNGGFDMSVVAAEERALVGLKLEENPSYANVFGMTSTMFGVQPYKRDDSDLWAGDFTTLDNHPYYTCSDSKKGAFDVRLPLQQSKYEQNLYNEGLLAGNMLYVLNSENCPIPEELRKEIGSKLKTRIKEYSVLAQDALMDDYGLSKSEARQVFRKSFGIGYKSYDESLDNNHFLIDEMNRIIEKECVDSLHVKYEDAFSPDRKTMFANLVRVAQCEGYNDVTIDNVMPRLRENYISSMSSDELYNLLWHATNNMYQNHKTNGSFDRNKKKDVDVHRRRMLQADEILPDNNDDFDIPHVAFGS